MILVLEEVMISLHAQPGYQRLLYDLNNPKLAPVVDICVLQSDSPHIFPPDDTYVWRRLGQDYSHGAGEKFTYIA